MLSSLILHLGENVDLKGKLAELRRWLEPFHWLEFHLSVRDNRVTALFTRLPKKLSVSIKLAIQRESCLR